MLKLLICVEAVDIDDTAQGFFVPWLQELSRQGIHAKIICLREGRHEELLHDVFVLPSGKGMYAKIRRGWELIRYSWGMRHGYDAVFVRGAPVFVLSAGWVWRLLNKRIVLWYAHYKTSSALNAAVVLSHVVVTSAKEACSIESNKLHVIGQSIDVTRFIIPAGKMFDTNRTIVLGRISEVKQVPRIIHLFERSIFSTRKNGELDIIGKPFDQSAEKVRELVQLNANVRWMKEGFSYDRIPEIVGAYDIMINLYEGSIDKSILEGMACGVIPIISTDAAEGLLPGNLHWLIARTDEEILGTMNRVAEMDGEARRTLAHTLREIVASHHSLKSQIHSIVHLATSG